MQIECRFFGPFREATGTERTLRETDVGTVGALLSDLEGEYPELAGRLVGDGEPAGSTVVTKEKRDVRHLDGLDTELEDGDVIRLVPSVYGG
ncbi:MoaD family protein [Halorarum halophilum]|uniref:MoaD family protein n=1 Tax=Halorarum halophilum TaxID=2743090 RepID=A0A7D5GAV9_9EURY|nr:MoaD family protein [Halobaculum halophilum]QLG26785.1 MoaD family protein [Halobaculum halophilum]